MSQTPPTELSLANLAGEGPDLIYMPEVAFDMDRFVGDVQAVYRKTGKVLVAVSEGIKDKDGVYIARYAKQDSAGDACSPVQMGGVGLVFQRGQADIRSRFFGG